MRNDLVHDFMATGILSPHVRHSSFTCSRCGAVLEGSSVLLIIRDLFNLWVAYREIVDRPPTSSMKLLELRKNTDLVTSLERIIDVFRLLVRDEHYSIAAVSHKISDLIASSIVPMYEELLVMSPANKKLQEQFNEYMNKYVQYAEIMVASMEVCCPKVDS